MSCSTSQLLSYPCHLPNHNSLATNQFLAIPIKFCPHKIHPRLNLTICSAEIAGNVQVEENEAKPKYRWLEPRPDSLTEHQKLAISQLPKKMDKKCKAMLRQIICFSSEKGSLPDLLAAWVKLMKPRRAGWLVVLKALRNMNHPLFLEIFELAISEESFEANVRDCTKMIHLYATHDRVQDAEKVVLTMDGRGFTCDQVTLTTMIHMYSKAGNFKLAEETFEKMKFLGKPLDKRSYGSMIMAYIRAGLPNKGEDLIKEMEDQEIYAGTEVYKALLRTYSMKGDAEGAQRVFDAIQVGGIFPDIKLCALLINAYVVAGQTHKACIAFENIKKAGIEPDDRCVALLLSSYEKENRVNTAMNFLVNLENEGIMIGKEASEVLVGWFRRLGIVEEVAQILRDFANAEVTD